MKVSLIAAMDEKRGIGKNNDLLFRIPEDFKRMKDLTNGHPIIMGRKTFESLRRPQGLPNRTNIIVTRSSNNMRSQNGLIYVNSLEEGIETARNVILNSSAPGGQVQHDKEKEGEMFIFGGGQIFKEAMEKGLVDRLYLTIVKGDYGADTFFPDYSGFKTVIHEEHGESNGYHYTFLDLEK